MVELGEARTVFETGRLVVTRWTLDDVQFCFALFGEPDVWRFLPGNPPSPAAGAGRLMERMLDRMRQWKGMGSFAVREREGGAIFGNVMLRPLE
jgi:RimJ/RimL family protein N-acetyltransferase